MESSGSGASPECGAGSIVWVRRRNGSWWPGKILGSEELPASHLTSPRTGTPVKLLGREDASVDWYNIEKSKRVKAFRCGEFDDCIEKAESSHGLPPKKREKYARREDAILHALELEKELFRKQGKLDFTPDHGSSKSSGSMKLDTADSDISNGKPGNLKSKQFLKRQETYNKGDIFGSPLDYEKQKDGNQPTSENYHAEFMPRMKGLQDLGLKTASPKEKMVVSGVLDGTSEPIAVDAQATSGKGPTMGRARDMNGEEQIEVISRAKRNRCMYLPSQTGDALEYKEIHPNLLDASAFQIGEFDSYALGRLVEDNTSEFMEAADSGFSESTSSELASEFDSSQTEADIDEEMVSLSGAAVPRKVKLDVPRRAEVLEDGGSESINESDESSLSGDTPHLYRSDPHSIYEAVSKWRLKGKRNMRNLVKGSVDADLRRFGGSTFRRKTSGPRSYRNDHIYDDDNDDDDDDDDDDDEDDDVTGFTTKCSRKNMVRLENGGYLQALRASLDRSGFNHNTIDWESRAALNQHWKDIARHFDRIFVGRQHYNGRMGSMLIDVDLQVQAGYPKGLVPIVSLMSKLDGKAIIGHPIQIETLEDGSSETLVPYLGNGFITNQERSSTSLPSAWRTAKRTNFRVPRPHLSTFGGDEGLTDHSFQDQERQSSLKKHNVLSLAGIGRKSTSHHPHSQTTDRKFQRKLPKRVILSSSQKIRTLSSIGIEQTVIARPFHGSINSQLDRGLIKPVESSRPTTVACIPVKLVFSRLLEKINRKPSQAAIGRMLLPTRDSS